MEKENGADIAAPSSTSIKEKAQKLAHQSPYLIGLVTLLLSTAAFTDEFKIPTIMLNLMDQFSMSATAASWLMSIVTLIGCVVALPTGKLTEKYGPKTIAIASGLTVIVGSLIGMLSSTSWMLIVSRAIEGVGVIAMTACAPVIVQKCVSPDRQGTAMSIYGVFGSVASGLAAVTTPTIFDTMGFHGVWLIAAAFMLIAILVLMVAVKLPPSQIVEKSVEIAADAKAKKEEAAGPKPSYKELMTGNLWLLFTGFIGINLTLLAVTSYIPSVLQMHGFNATVSGLASSLPMLVSIVASPILGIFSDKTGKTKPILIISLLSLGPCAFVMFNSTGVALWIAAVILGIIGFSTVGLFMAVYTSILPRVELVSLGLGLLSLISTGGQFLGSFIVQLLLGPNLDRIVVAGIGITVLTWLAALCVSRVNMSRNPGAEE